MNIFERASRKGLRFPTAKGLISTDDLWTLSLQSLDSIAKAVNKKLKEEGEESFIEEKSAVSTELQLQLDILKHIIASKLEDKTRAAKAAEAKARIEVIKNKLAEKEEQALNSKTREELLAELNTLQGS